MRGDNTPVDAIWLRSVFPATATHGKRAHYASEFGRIGWNGLGEDLIFWLNGEIYPYRQATRRDVRLLCRALRNAMQE